MKGDNKERIQISYYCLMEEKRRLLQTVSDRVYLADSSPRKREMHLLLPIASQ